MKRRNFLKQLGVAATLPWLGRVAFAAPDAPTKTATHKILTCNVRVDVPADSLTGDGWVHRREFCGDVIQAQKADLIGLQEAQAAHLNYLKSRMPEYDSYALSNSVATFHPANAILYRRERYELISAGGFWLSETPHVASSKSWDSANPRFINWVDLKVRETGKQLRYWNTHLDHKGQEARVKGAALIVEASKVVPEEFPQLLTGDMNARANNAAIKNFTTAGWQDTYAAVNGPADPGFTAHGFKGVNSPAKGADGTPRGKIDWIFYRGPVKALSAAVIRDSREGHYPSDHYFVSAEVSL